MKKSIIGILATAVIAGTAIIIMPGEVEPPICPNDEVGVMHQEQIYCLDEAEFDDLRIEIAGIIEENNKDEENPHDIAPEDLWLTMQVAEIERQRRGITEQDMRELAGSSTKEELRTWIISLFN